MIGIVVVGLQVLPESMIISAQLMLGKQEFVVAVPLAPHEDSAAQRRAILNAIDSVDNGSGILVLVDSMASPAGYLMISLMDKVDVDVIGGVNLPMLCKVLEKRNEHSVEGLAEFARDEGRKGISWRS